MLIKRLWRAGWHHSKLQPSNVDRLQPGSNAVCFSGQIRARDRQAKSSFEFSAELKKF